MPDPRQHLVKLWREYFKSKRGFESPMTWGAMMNILYRKFEMAVDQKTGEVFQEDYPTEEAWLRETEGFFEDPFAFQTNYAFEYFVKAYGKFGKPPKRNVLALLKQVGAPMTSPTNKNEQFRCGKCGQIHSPKLICQ